MNYQQAIEALFNDIQASLPERVNHTIGRERCIAPLKHSKLGLWVTYEEEKYFACLKVVSSEATARYFGPPRDEDICYLSVRSKVMMSRDPKTEFGEEIVWLQLGGPCVFEHCFDPVQSCASEIIRIQLGLHMFLDRAKPQHVPRVNIEAADGFTRFVRK